MEKKRTIIIATAAILVLIAGGSYGGYAYHNHQYAQATIECTTETKGLRNIRKTRAGYLKSQEARTAMETRSTDVRNTKTVIRLATDSRFKIKPTTCMTDSSLKELKNDNVILKNEISGLSLNLATMKKDVTAVNTSKAAKALDTDINSASKTLSDSNGKVQDGKTRDTLTSEIGKAKKVAANVKATLKQLNDAKTSLDQKVKAVNDSVNAKNKADADAKAAADAQSAAASAPATSSGSGYLGYNGYSGGPGYSGSNYRSGRYLGGGSTYRAPAAPVRPAPAPKTPAGGNGGGGFKPGVPDSGGNMCTTDAGSPDGSGYFVPCS